MNDIVAGGRETTVMVDHIQTGRIAKLSLVLKQALEMYKGLGPGLAVGHQPDPGGGPGPASTRFGSGPISVLVQMTAIKR